MSHFAVHEGGRILRTFSFPKGVQLPREEAGALPCGQEVTPLTHFVRGGQVVPIPAGPGSGWVFDFSSGAWVFSVDMAWQLVRADRDARLKACDWRVLPDAPTPPEEREFWLAYRQAVRDNTEQTDPCVIVWPKHPF